MAVNTPAATERANGLSTALNVIISPSEAFETLRTFPMWGWALIITLVLAGIGSVLAEPAQMHAMHATMVHMYATDPKLSTLSDDQKASQMALSESFGKFGILFLPIILFIATAIQTAIMLLVNAAARGKANFKSLWCGMMNVNVVSFGVAQLINGILAVIKGPDAYNTTVDQFMAIPSVAWIVPGTAPKLTAFLAVTLNPISLWALVLTALMLIGVARIGKVPAYATSVILLLIGGLFATFAIR